MIRRYAIVNQHVLGMNADVHFGGISKLGACERSHGLDLDRGSIGLMIFG